MLQEDFYSAYLNSAVAFRSQRVYSLESLVVAIGEQIRPHLTYLPGLSDLLGWTSRYVPSWVHEFYSSLWIDPRHRFIHFAFRSQQVCSLESLVVATGEQIRPHLSYLLGCQISLDGLVGMFHLGSVSSTPPCGLT